MITNNDVEGEYKCTVMLRAIITSSWLTKNIFTHTANVHLTLTVSIRQLICMYFPQSGYVHCIHSRTNCQSIKSSSYSPKQVAHSLLEISASSCSHLYYLLYTYSCSLCLPISAQLSVLFQPL